MLYQRQRMEETYNIEQLQSLEKLLPLGLSLFCYSAGNYVWEC